MGKFTMGLGGFIALVAVMILSGSFYSVDEGEKSVITRNGAVTGIAEPGFHTKMPFIDNTHDVSLRDAMLSYEDIKAYTRDGQTATVHRISISYRVKPANDSVIQVYSRYGTAENAVSQMVTRRVGETLETVFGQFNADNAIQRRADLGAEFSKRIKNIDGPVEILAAQIENFSLPDTYEKNIEAKMTQEVEVKKLEEQEKQNAVTNRIAVATATANAAARIAEATASAEAVRLAGEAEADAMTAKNNALAANPALIEYQKALTWDGALPASMVPGATIPFMQIK